MSSVRVEMTGRRFGTLTVIEGAERDRWGQWHWRCRCDCGQEHVAAGGKLRSGEIKSCGCDKPRMCAEANAKHGASARGRMTVEYETWSSMIKRCEDTNQKSYKDYGGRGIRVCAKWRSDFAAFLADVGPRPSPAYSINRIENDGNYEPGNVNWATKIEQMQNRRSVRNVEWRGETHCLKEWARIVGIKYLTLYMRLKTGWTIDEALATPTRVRLAARGAN